MAFMDLFKKKPPAQAPEAPLMMPPAGPPPGAPAGLPVDDVVQMQAQGLSNQEISAALQQQGYTTQQIYDAIAQAKMKPTEEPFAMRHEVARPAAPEEHEKTGAGVEEMAESIIEEKWHELTRELDKFSEWKELTSSRMDKVDQSVADLKADLDNLHKAIVAKIGDYDKNLLDVGTEIKAMEKVFQKVLPELTTNVAELSRMTKTAKGKKVVEKPSK